MTAPDAANTARRRELAMIHIGAKQLGLDPRDPDPDSAYRQMLGQVAGVRSAAALDHAGRRAVLEHLRGRGFKPAPQGRSGRRGTPQSRLVRHIWGRLADAGVVQHREGLGAWLAHNTRRDHPQGAGWRTPEWLPRPVAARIVEQLKQWAEREGVQWR